MSDPTPPLRKLTKRELFLREYQDHLETWGPHCGAPLSVFKGHLDILLRAQVEATEERLKFAASHHQATSG